MVLSNFLGKIQKTICEGLPTGTYWPVNSRSPVSRLTRKIHTLSPPDCNSKAIVRLDQNQSFADSFLASTLHLDSSTIHPSRWKRSRYYHAIDFRIKKLSVARDQNLRAKVASRKSVGQCERVWRCFKLPDLESKSNAATVPLLPESNKPFAIRMK